MLSQISTRDVGPLDFDLSLAPRLNLLTGDNGLGKTFLLDLAWWSTTHFWSGLPAIPRRRSGAMPTVTSQFLRPDLLGLDPVPFRGQFSSSVQDWVVHFEGPIDQSRLILYAHWDGGFDVLDDHRAKVSLPPNGMGVVMGTVSHRNFSFDPESIWNGLIGDDGTVRCNGLIRDWAIWQFQRPEVFALFSRVLAKLSPHPNEVIRPGPIQRISIADARDIPTLQLPYGIVPVTHASAGMRRILALAYMLVWTWHEHQEAARLRNVAPVRELILLIDEVEAHLHPMWQRSILPALFSVIPELEKSLQVQLIASTHAPLVLASVETLFDPARDKLFHFAMDQGQITVEDIPWSKQGDVVNWLTSETFGLQQARSREAERAIEAAEAFTTVF